MRKVGRKGSEGDIEDILKLIDDVLNASLRGTAVIVEGRNDEEALRMMGVQGKVIRYSELGGRKLVDVLERNGLNHLLVLTDFDEEGEEIAMKVEKLAEENGFKVDRGLRLRFKKHFNSYSATIEGLKGILNQSLERRLKISKNNKMRSQPI